MTKILFIINPISGEHNKAEIIRAIPKILDKNRFDIFITHSKRAGHAAEIAQKAVAENIDIVVAVGGDGTINEVATQLVSANTALAIVPCGSGNGLARDLGISLRYKEAIQQINKLELKKIDVGVCNNQYFFSIAGVGYDAKVAYDFNRGKKRKFAGYLWAIVKDYFNVKDQPFEIELEEEKTTGKYFLISVANCSQWGYNVKVAPGAKLDDGLFIVNLCKKPSIFSVIPFGIKLLAGKIEHSKHADFKTTKKISITSDMEFFYHLDGDAKGISRQINIDILPHALMVLY
jgi:YegS/Rv2252/BmrU family lipid kinase